jgi:hypothetical protein
MITDPRAAESRRAKEATIRVIDMIVYAFVIASGVFALTVPPETIQRWLAGWEWVAFMWGWLLIVAGTLGLVGRLTRVWAVEIPAPIAALFGQAIYVLVLAATAFGSATVWVALCMIIGASFALLRRYIELLIFTTDPEARTLTDRLVEALRRRTPNVAGRHR